MLEKGFSIVIATLNSEDRIKETIEYISKLKTIPTFSFELIIVNNNSTDATEVVAQNTCKASFENHEQWKVLNEPTQGKVNALERAINISKYEYLVICDDDNLLDPDYLLHAFKILENRKGIGAIGGKCTARFEIDPPSWFFKYQQSYAVGTISNIDANGGYIYHLWGAGIVMRKGIYDKLINKRIDFLTGKFGHTAYMTGEDHELCLFIRQLGWKIFFSPKLHFIHVIPASRLSWEYFKNLTIRNSLPEIYLDIYHFLEKCSLQNKLPKGYIFIYNQFIKILPQFLSNLSKKVAGILLNKSQGYAFDAALNYNKYQLREVWHLRQDIDHKINIASTNLDLLNRSVPN